MWGDGATGRKAAMPESRSDSMISMCWARIFQTIAGGNYGY
jgi:uncharacterized protein involved in type VI secretion and phage assembly